MKILKNLSGKSFQNFSAVTNDNKNHLLIVKKKKKNNTTKTNDTNQLQKYITFLTMLTFV